jgi:hypothetical protein
VGPDDLAVGPNRTVVIVPTHGASGIRVKWRTGGSGWSTTWVSRAINSCAFASAVDSSGRILVMWSRWREGIPQYGNGFMSTHRSGWTTTELWDWARNTNLAAAAVSWNGRAVAIRTTINLQGRTTAVQMRVLQPG